MALDSLHLMQVFVCVAETRSFTAAARQLGISTSGVSKAIGRLEEHLAARLLVRTTRTVRLSEEGIAFLETCRQILTQVEEAETRFVRRIAAPRGRIRIQSPMGFGRFVLLPLLRAFAARYPELSLDIDLSEREVDLARDGIDVAVRVGRLASGQAVARRVGLMNFVAVASPAYLSTHGEPRTPADLARHRCLGYYLPQKGGFREWAFVEEGAGYALAPSGQINMNSAELLAESAAAGEGIACVASFVAFEAIKAGRLRVILREHTAPGSTISLLYLERRYKTPRVRVLVDWLAERIRADHWWEAVV